MSAGELFVVFQPVGHQHRPAGHLLLGADCPGVELNVHWISAAGVLQKGPQPEQQNDLVSLGPSKATCLSE